MMRTAVPTADEFNSNTLFSTSTSGTTTYIATLPVVANPPAGARSSGNNSFSYLPTPDGASYTISYCLGGATGSLTSGIHCATPAGISNGTNCLEPSGLTILANFTGANGHNPGSGLIVSGNTLYDTTEEGGTSNDGVIFKVNADGTGYQIIKSFHNTDGGAPICTLVRQSGILHGVASYGGANDDGIIYSLDTNGNNFHDLWYFDDSNPSGFGGPVYYGSVFVWRP